MRARFVFQSAAQILAIVAASTSFAGPLDPPAHTLRVAVLEPTTKHPTQLKLTMTFAPSQDFGAIVIAGFQQDGNRRKLNDDTGAWYIEARHGGLYPSVAVNGSGPLPPCPAAVLCSTPTFPPDVEQHVDVSTFHFQPVDTHLRFYLFLNDVDISFAVNAGWRMRYVKGGSLLQFRDTGTEVRVSAAYRQYMVEDFHGVSAPRVNGPSVAFATIPCWPPPAPGGTGTAVLRNDGNGAGRQSRTMACDGYVSTAQGASERPTTWHNDGASLGWSGGFVNRLVVAVLPPT
jgi:hypothetical protein